MVEERSRVKLLVYAAIFVVLLYGLLRIFVDGTTNFFRLELVGFFFLLLLMLIGFIGYVSVWGERVFFFVFLLYLANLAGIWYYNGSFYLVLLFLTLVGFMMSVPKHLGKSKVGSNDYSDSQSVDKSGGLLKQDSLEGFEKDPHSIVLEPSQTSAQSELRGTKSTAPKPALKRSSPQKSAAQKSTAPKPKTSKPAAKTTKYSPGKYVASKNSNVYHEPKCDWAKRIQRNRRLWFKSKEAAWEKGYKGHSCIK